MKMKPWLFLVMTLTLLMISQAVPILIDLSHDLGPDVIPVLASGPRYKLKPFFAGTLKSGVYVEQNYFTVSEHAGTHIDVPAVLRRGDLTTDEVPLESTVTYGVMIDCSREASQRRDYEAPVQKILDWEKVNGRIPDGAAVIFNFGWFRYYHDQYMYRGSHDLDNITTYVYPSVAPETVRFLLKYRNISMLGTDSIAVDVFQRYGKPTVLPNHQLMLGKNRIIVESLANLDKLPPRGFLFSAAPVKYVGSNGPQVRAYAIILGDDQSCRCGPTPQRSARRLPQRKRNSGRYVNGR